MKPFFVIALLVSIVFPFYSLWTMLGNIEHNQSATRFARLKASQPPATELSARYGLPESPHFGLWKTQLSGVDRFFADAYGDAVYDGFRLGNGYQALWWESLVLDGVLFVVSVAGLTADRKPAK